MDLWCFGDYRDPDWELDFGRGLEIGVTINLFVCAVIGMMVSLVCGLA